MNNTDIPNIHIGQAYDQRYKDADIHYEALGNLADFFGRTMRTHRHDRFFQVHYVKSGVIHLFLDEHQYHGEAPLFFITPPVVPHSFVTEDGSDGHVLTVRQQVVWSILDEIPELKNNFKITPACVPINKLPKELTSEAKHLDYLLEHLRAETDNAKNIGQASAIQGLIRLIFISLFRLAEQSHLAAVDSMQYETTRLFRQFTELVEEHYKQHWLLSAYANLLNITEAKLNELCRQIGNISPKQLIHDRLMQEAKYSLLFTEQSIMEIGYQLGFQDPAYFSRFFTRQAGTTPKEYRKAMANQPYRQYFMR